MDDLTEITEHVKQALSTPMSRYGIRRYVHDDKPGLAFWEYAGGLTKEELFTALEEVDYPSDVKIIVLLGSRVKEVDILIFLLVACTAKTKEPTEKPTKGWVKVILWSTLTGVMGFLLSVAFAYYTIKT